MRLDEELLHGAVDIHVHVGPDLYPRIQTCVEYARSARDAGLKAVCVKTHNFPTVHMAEMTYERVPGIDVFGSIACNLYLDLAGVNPIAVEAALKYGARQVFLPTVDSRNQAHITGQLGQHGKGLVVKGGRSDFSVNHPRIELVGEDGTLSAATREAIQLIADADVILNFGHTSLREIRVVLEAARRQGVKRMVLDHPFWAKVPVDAQEELAGQGVFINYVAMEILPRWRAVSVEDFAAGIRRIGPERAVISSDCGQLHNPPPVEGLRLLCQLLIEEGLTADEIRRMLHRNAADLLYP